jgi:ATP-dependent Clp protease ATP-binding subunit ClpA
VSSDETERLIKMEETLHQRVIGQEEAVVAISRAIRRFAPTHSKLSALLKISTRPNHNTSLLLSELPTNPWCGCGISLCEAAHLIDRL